MSSASHGKKKIPAAMQFIVYAVNLPLAGFMEIETSQNLEIQILNLMSSQYIISGSQRHA